MSTSLVVAAFAVVAFQAYGVSAQGTNATCSASFSWATNSRGQSPCLQAAYLNGACLSDPQDAYVYSLPEDFHYRPPSAAIATPCQCSTVFYSVLAACADCQNRQVLPWSAWETNCSTVYTGIWPVNVPPGTSIPAWAFIDVVTPDTFNATAARALAASNPAESSPAAAPATSISFSATGSASAANNAPSEGSSSSNSGSSHKSNVGPIVGGVVGGVGGAAILAGIIAFLVIRHRRNSAAAVAAQGGTTPLAGSDSAFAPQDPSFPPSGQQPQMYQPQGAGYASVPPPQSYSPAPAPLSPSTATGPLYNPDDPSTFPGAPAPGSGSGYAPSQYTGGPPSSQAPLAPHAYQHQPGRYTGVAEV